MQINGTDDAPVISGTFIGTVIEDDIGDTVTATGTIAISDVDINDTPAFLDTTLTGTYGSLVLVGRAWTYTLDQTVVQAMDLGDVVTETITLTATDGTTQDITVTVVGTNDVPVLVTDYYVVPDGEVLTEVVGSGLLANDSDLEGHALTLTKVTVESVEYIVPGTGSTSITTSNGVLSIGSDGAFTYTPDAGYVGLETFTYTVSDGQGGLSSEVFSIEVDAVAEAPTAVSAELGNGGYAYSVATDKASGDAYLWRIDMLTGEIKKMGLRGSVWVDIGIFG